MREHVDEARRDGESLGIDNGWRRGPAQIADGGDAIAFDSDVGFDWRATTAVIDGAAFDDHIE